MDIKELSAPEADQEHSEAVRRFIRHPSDFPIAYSQGVQQEKQQPLRDVSCGGLCFTSECSMQQGEVIHISIPVEPPGFEADCVVAWCKKEEDHFAVGVEFAGDSTSFTLRMVEQVCHIEHYRSEVARCEGRELTSEEAAQEWIEKYAKDFPRH